MKIKVFLSGYIAILLVFFVGDSLLWLEILLNGINQLDILSWILLGLFAGVLPISVIIWSTITLADTIFFDEYGVSRIRFGKIVKQIDWVNVKTVSSTVENNFAGWIYIAEIDIKYYASILSVSKMRLNKHVIYFHQSEKAKKVLENYMPESCKKMCLKAGD